MTLEEFMHKYHIHTQAHPEDRTTIFSLQISGTEIICDDEITQLCSQRCCDRLTKINLKRIVLQIRYLASEALTDLEGIDV